MPLPFVSYLHGTKIWKGNGKVAQDISADCGLLHALLDASTSEQLESHPKLGSSWEGFCIEQILSVTGSSNAYFWGTHAGAELDLLLLRNGKRIGVEIKYSDGPSTTRSMRSAMEDLKLDHLYVAYPGKEDYPLDKKISVMSLPSILAEFETCKKLAEQNSNFFIKVSTKDTEPSELSMKVLKGPKQIEREKNTNYMGSV